MQTDRHPRAARRQLLLACAALCTALLSACGGGGQDESPPSTAEPPPVGSGVGAAACFRGNDLAPAELRTGARLDEQRWLLAHMEQRYLWFDEIPRVDPANARFDGADHFGAMSQYLDALKSTRLDAAGLPRDRFSFAYPTQAWRARAEQGAASSTGIDWVVGSASPPRVIQVALVQPNSPASSASVRRGMALVSVNGVSVDATSQGELQTLNELVFRPIEGRPYDLVLRDLNGQLQNVRVIAGNIEHQPVSHVNVIPVGNRRVGYIAFHDHVAPAEGQLVSAIGRLRDAAVSDLVLDLRYNGGGYLHIAARLGYMIAGADPTQGKDFERLRFNAKRSEETNSPNAAIPFLSVTSGFRGSGTVGGAPLPTLGLRRVYVLTTESTCSASESVINGLRGADLEVVIIGGATCGKPYGFVGEDRCGISYFAVEFEGVNHKGVGGYVTGFAPNCAAKDDLSSELGNTQEGMLTTALKLITGESCPAPTGADVGQGMPRSRRAGPSFMQERWHMPAAQ